MPGKPSLILSCRNGLIEAIPSSRPCRAGFCFGSKNSSTSESRNTQGKHEHTGQAGNLNPSTSAEPRARICFPQEFTPGALGNAAGATGVFHGFRVSLAFLWLQGLKHGSKPTRKQRCHQISTESQRKELPDHQIQPVTIPTWSPTPEP